MYKNVSGVSFHAFSLLRYVYPQPTNYISPFLVTFFYHQDIHLSLYLTKMNDLNVAYTD